MKIKFKVINNKGVDVTNLHDWYIDSNGDLFCETDDIDSPLYPVEDYTYEICTD